METISSDFEKLILRPPSEVEESILDQHHLIASVFLHPDHPDHLELEDVQAAVCEAEEGRGGGVWNLAVNNERR